MNNEYIEYKDAQDQVEPCPGRPLISILCIRYFEGCTTVMLIQNAAGCVHICVAKMRSIKEHAHVRQTDRPLVGEIAAKPRWTDEMHGRRRVWWRYFQTTNIDDCCLVSLGRTGGSSPQRRAMTDPSLDVACATGAPSCCPAAINTVASLLRRR